MLSVSYAGKNANSAGKTSGLLRGGASRANRCYVLAHCASPSMDLLNASLTLLYKKNQRNSKLILRKSHSSVNTNKNIWEKSPFKLAISLKKVIVNGVRKCLRICEC